MNFSWHLQGFSSLRSAPAERFTLLRFAGGGPSTHIGHEDGAAEPAGLQGVDDLVGDVGVVQDAGGDVDHAGAAGAGPDAHPSCCHHLLHGPPGVLSVGVLGDTHTLRSPPSTVTAMAQTATERGFPLSQAICSPGIPSRLLPFHCHTIYFILANTQHPLSSHSSSGISLLPNVFIHQ